MPDLSDNVNWSEVDADNNQAPPNGWPEGMMPSGVNDAARADRGAMKRFWNKLNPVQIINSSGGVYTFTTGNTAYPTAYVSGEIYCFMPNNHSVGNDQFQVNALGPKPIWKRFAPGLAPDAFAAIIAYDILGQTPVQLVYNPVLNAGTGAFVLLNPYIPLQNDGSGTTSVMHGNLVINRNSAAPPPVWSASPTTESVPLQIIGNDGENPVLALNSFGANPGALRLIHAEGTGAAPTHTNSGDDLGNLAWEGYGATGWPPPSARIEGIALETFTDSAQGACLTLTTTPVGHSGPVTQAVIGPGLTVGAPPAPSGGMLIGDINAQRLFCSGAASIGGAFTAASVSISGSTSFGNVTVTGLTVNGNETVTGGLAVTNNANVGGTLNVTGGVTLPGGLNVSNGVHVNSGGLNVTGGLAADALAVSGNASINTVTVGAVPGGVETAGSVNLQDLYFSGQHVLSSVQASLPAGARILYLA